MCHAYMYGLGGAEKGKDDKICVFKAFLKGSSYPRGDSENEQVSGPDRLGGGRGRVNPPPRRLVWRVCDGIYTPRG